MARTNWDHLKLPRARWNYLERDGFSKKLIQKKKKFIEETVRAILLPNRIQY